MHQWFSIKVRVVLGWHPLTIPGILALTETFLTVPTRGGDSCHLMGRTPGCHWTSHSVPKNSGHSTELSSLSVDKTDIDQPRYSFLSLLLFIIRLIFCFSIQSSPTSWTEAVRQALSSKAVSSPKTTSCCLGGWGEGEFNSCELTWLSAHTAWDGIGIDHACHGTRILGAAKERSG